MKVYILIEEEIDCNGQIVAVSEDLSKLKNVVGKRKWEVEPSYSDKPKDLVTGDHIQGYRIVTREML